MKRRRRLRFQAVLAGMALLLVGHASAAPTAPLLGGYCFDVATLDLTEDTAQQQRSDDVVLEALRIADDNQPDIEGACFATAAERNQAEDVAFAGKDRSLLAIHYDGNDYSGEDYHSWSTSNYGCLTGYKYKVEYLKNGWTDRINSTMHSSGCDVINHFEIAYFNGVKIDCSDCGHMGIMNNETSSVKYKP